MSDRSPDGTPPDGRGVPPADPTRDITLPPLPDRPAPAVRPEWTPYVPAPQETRAAPAAEPPRQATQRSYDLPTDRLAGRGEAARSRTSTFQPPPPVQLLEVSVGARRRRGRWLWSLAILVPLLVIAGSGIWLLVTFYAG